MSAAWRRPRLAPQTTDPEGFRLRPMTRADLRAILALERDLFPDDAWTPAMFREEFAQPPGSRVYVVAEDPAGQVVGYAGMMFPPDDTADVLTIAVRQSTWGRGVGSALLRALVEAARRRGRGQVLLEVREDNPRARTLYQHRGFEEIGVRKGYYQPSGVDAIVMRKELR
jgi:[ribosomal protein S18]-alanine N-acetyltransferase